MAENKPKKKQSNPLVGSQTQPITLDNTTTLDIDVKKTLIDNIIEAGLSSQLDIARLENFTSISNSRDQIYQLIDTMAQDSAVSAILKTYAENACEPADNGHIIWCEANDPNISKYVNYILNTMNADKNMYRWAYSLCQYGDVYLRLFRESDYEDDLFKADNVNMVDSSRSRLTEDFTEVEKLEEAVKLHVHSDYDPYSFYVEQTDDPGTMFELGKFGKTYGYIEVPNENNSLDATSTLFGGQSATGVFNFKMKSADVNVWQADDFVHGCLEDNFTRYPETVELFIDKDGTKSQSYKVRRGKSILYDNYKVWRERSLLENAALLNRITRSSIVRKVGVEVGDMPKEQVQLTLRRVKDMMEQKSTINVGNSMSEYNNPGPVENNIYFATHGGQGNITIEAVGGDVDVKNLADLDYWNNKFYSAYGVPKQYYGWCLGADTKIPLLNGSTPTIEELYNNKEDYIGKGIMGCNQDGSLCPTKITNIMLTKPNATLMRIWLDNGEYVDVTPDHRMMLRDGTFIPAGELKENDSLMPYDLINNKVPEAGHNIVKIEYLEGTYPVYDLTVEDDCHTFALACGIFVHNCEDAAGFNGGTSLAILSSEFAKGVKRVQNALIQMVTDAINLFLLNRGLKSYLNNFTLKMKAPVTQEEIDYRNEFTNKINAISSLQGLFTDVEDKPRRLRILKALIASLNYGDEINAEIDAEIVAAEEAAKKAEEEAALAGESAGADITPEAPAEDTSSGTEDIDLGTLDALESFNVHEGEILTEDGEFANIILTEDDLPSPEELDSEKDFSENV